eukprot:jgi/Botrbrau1/6837/Bobra.152_2s0002.1
MTQIRRNGTAWELATLISTGGLAPYNLKGWATWQRLTNRINRDVIETLVPHNIFNFSVTAEPDTGWAGPGSREEAALDQALHQQRSQLGATGTPIRSGMDAAEQQRKWPEVGRCRYPLLARRFMGSNYSSEELTQHNLDKSLLLEQAIAEQHGQEACLGNLQYAFLAFWLGHSLEAFDFWREFVGLVLGCETALKTDLAEFFAVFIQTLRVQINQSWQGDNETGREGKEDLDSVAQDMLQDSFLQRSVFRFLGTVRDTGTTINPAVQKEAGKLESLTKKLQWKHYVDSEEDEENAPAIVEL